MATTDINTGTLANDLTGTNARAAGQIINANFAYLEAQIAASVSGDVFKSGTQTAGQVAVFTADGVIEGTDELGDIVVDSIQFVTGASTYDITGPAAIPTVNVTLSLPEVSGVLATIADINTAASSLDAAIETIAAYTTAPATATSTGIPGQIAKDASYFYVATATNTWKRVALSSDFTGGTLNTFYGGLGMAANTTATTIAVSGTYYKVLGTTTANALSSFTHASNRLTYTGATTRYFKISASPISMISAGTNIRASLKFAKNGTVIGYPVTRKINTGSDVGACSLSFDVSLATNDYVEIFVTNETNTSSVTVEDLYFSITAIN